MTEMKWKYFPWIYFLLEKRIIGGMDRIFVVNEDGLEFYKNLYPDIASRFRFFPTWVDEDTFYPNPIRKKRQIQNASLLKMHLPSDTKIILFAGRLEPPKNPMLLLKVFSFIKDKYKSVVLVIVGDGSLKKAMQDFAHNCHISDSVRFVGALPQEDLAGMMRTADLFLLTSSFEGMPMAILESLMCGLPIVSTDVGGVKDFIKQNFCGMVVRERQPEVIAECVLKILSNPLQFKQTDCVNAARPFSAKKVLAPLYDYHWKLMGKVT
jgi:glycosyltransferase involved in cell wall biosynthesis